TSDDSNNDDNPSSQQLIQQFLKELPTTLNTTFSNNPNRP
ncbi:7198_t:CDS:1, partial [Racocetra fulgida]